MMTANAQSAAAVGAVAALRAAEGWGRTPPASAASTGAHHAPASSAPSTSNRAEHSADTVCDTATLKNFHSKNIL